MLLLNVLKQTELESNVLTILPLNVFMFRIRDVSIKRGGMSVFIGRGASVSALPLNVFQFQIGDVSIERGSVLVFIGRGASASAVEELISGVTRLWNF